MLAFLGAVVDDDIDQGIIEPSYWLCKGKKGGKNGLGYRVVAANSRFRNMTKLLVTSLAGNEDLIEFMSSFRSCVYYKTRNRDRFFVHGAIFWFPCDKYGRRNNLPPVFISKIPVKGRRSETCGERTRTVRNNRDKRLNHYLADEPTWTTLETFNVKRKMPDYKVGKRRKNDDKNKRNEAADRRKRKHPAIGEIGFKHAPLRPGARHAKRGTKTV